MSKKKVVMVRVDQDKWKLLKATGKPISYFINLALDKILEELKPRGKK